MTENNMYVTDIFQVTKVTTFTLPESINEVIEVIFIKTKSMSQSRYCKILVV